MYKFQTTISREEKFTGIGLHSGKNVTVKLSPAEANTGIVFIRKDLNNFSIKALAENVVNTTMCTVIGIDGIIIQTVEHFLSALAATGIDNLYIEVDAPEMPIMDGSAAPYIYIIKEAGIKSLRTLKKYLKIKEKIEIAENDKKVSLSPSDSFEMSFFLDYNHPLISKQFYNINLSKQSYIDEISRARTFGFLKEVEQLRAMNLALGGSLENAVVIDEEKILNPEGLRYSDEFVRHKILDALGDLYLIGYPIIGSYFGHKAGHYLNNKLCKKILNTPNAWELVEFPEFKAAQGKESFTPLYVPKPQTAFC